jgi:hypothetical protein
MYDDYHLPEDDNHHSHRRGNLKSYKYMYVCLFHYFKTLWSSYLPSSYNLHYILAGWLRMIYMKVCCVVVAYLRLSSRATKEHHSISITETRARDLTDTRQAWYPVPIRQQPGTVNSHYTRYPFDNSRAQWTEIPSVHSEACTPAGLPVIRESSVCGLENVQRSLVST